MLDFHNHLVPGVDDGAQSIAESELDLAALSACGFTALITTPHLSASTLRHGSAGEYFRLVDAGWAELREVGNRKFPGLALERGFEVLLDYPDVDFSDDRLRLAGSRFVLVEFPWGAEPVFAAKALFEIRSQGYRPIIAHPERYAYMDRGLRLAAHWLTSGALLQLNEGSLVGRYGPRAATLAWRALELGYISYVCTDFHSGEPLTLHANAAVRRLRGGEEALTLLRDVNPNRILTGGEPEPVPALGGEARSVWHRIRTTVLGRRQR